MGEVERKAKQIEEGRSFLTVMHTKTLQNEACLVYKLSDLSVLTHSLSGCGLCYVSSDLNTSLCV